MKKLSMNKCSELFIRSNIGHCLDIKAILPALDKSFYCKGTYTLLLNQFFTISYFLYVLLIQKYKNLGKVEGVLPLQFTDMKPRKIYFRWISAQSCAME